MSITFNHEAESFHESIGVNSDEFSIKMHEVIKDFCINTKDHKISRLSDLLHNRMNDAELLILASNFVLSKFDELENDMNMMDTIFKNLFHEN